MRERPDVALIDIGLPGIDGYEVARQLRGIDGLRHLRLIALTGYGQAGDKANAVVAGFNQHLTKPVSTIDLMAAVAGTDGSDESGVIRFGSA